MNLQKGKDPALKLDLSFLLYASRGIILPPVSERRPLTLQHSLRRLCSVPTGPESSQVHYRSTSVGARFLSLYILRAVLQCIRTMLALRVLLVRKVEACLSPFCIQGPRLCLYISPLVHSSTRSKCIFDVSQDSLSLTMSNSTAPHMATRFRTSSSVSTSMPEWRTRSWGNRARPPSLSGGTMLSLVTHRRSNPPPFWRTYLYLLPLIASFPLNKGVNCRAAPGVSVSGQRVTPNI